jgi:hypothetical protein
VLVGTSGRRELAASSPHIDYWNCWYAWYRKSPSGFAKLSSRFQRTFRRSACVLVIVGAGGERPHDPASPHIDVSRRREHLGELHAAGADDAILVLDRINERTVIKVAHELAL